MIDKNVLAQFRGTDGYTRYSPLFRRLLLTDGAKYVAENGGTNGAFWLMDAIGSYQSKLLKKECFQEYQFWKLEVTGSSAVLTCREDTGVKPAVKQKIEYTDFDLASIELWVMPMGDGNYVIMLPSEH